MQKAVIIPSLGGDSLSSCAECLTHQETRPDKILLVLSGAAHDPEVPEDVDILRFRQRLGFAAAINRGIGALERDIEFIALLNDDAFVSPSWLDVLVEGLREHPEAGSVQGTVLDAAGNRIDGRGIGFDHFGLPYQLDHGVGFASDPPDGHEIPGASATAVLYRRSALESVRLPGGDYFDEHFDSYVEDVDMALRLRRKGWTARWQGGAVCRHAASSSGKKLRYRRPWWILSNRWRMLGANLTAGAVLINFPRFLRGDLRAARHLVAEDSAALPAALLLGPAIPFLLAGGLLRPSPGPRTRRLPEDSR